MTDPTTVDDEINAMKRIAATLNKLDTKAQDRVVGWMWERYRLDIPEIPDHGEGAP